MIGSLDAWEKRLVDDWTMTTVNGFVAHLKAAAARVQAFDEPGAYI